MNWSPLNPLNSLTGRLVLVTVVAVLLSYAAAFFFYAHERGAEMRRTAESAVVDRIAYTADRLQQVPLQERRAAASFARDFGIRYDISNSPSVERSASSGPGARVAHAVADRLGGIDVRGSARHVDRPSRRWRMSREHLREHRLEYGDEPPPERLVRSTEVSVSVQLASAQWLNARAFLPGPRPLPLGSLAGALFSVIAVGVGAALVARQIGRPLSDLAHAAQALGAGDTGVSAPVSGPADVRRASTAFNAMAGRLGRQIARQRQMLWALSHDLRTPITALKLRAELIEDESARQRLLAPISEIERLTEQALDLARAGASEEARGRVDLAEIARTLCGELADLGMNVRAEANEPVFVECRPSEIARALRNLAENAARHGGGGVMRVYKESSGEVSAEVRDDGPGVSEATLARLAEPFFRADEARSAPNGAGLGLAIAQAIADSHGGRLTFANLSPRGFSAKLTLPG